MAKKNPSDAYRAAVERLRRARENCAHWDYDGDGDGQHDCCAEVENARRSLKIVRVKNGWKLP